MRRVTQPDAPVPPSRIARWAVPGVVAMFALISALQHHRSPAVTVCALVVTVAAALLMAPGRPALLAVFAALSAAGLAVLGSGSASDVGWFGVCVLAGWCAFTLSAGVAVALWAAFVIMFGLEWLLTTNDLGWASWIAGTTFITSMSGKSAPRSYTICTAAATSWYSLRCVTALDSSCSRLWPAEFR